MILIYPKDGDPEKYSNCDIAETATKKERIPVKKLLSATRNICSENTDESLYEFR